jgi:hypothetical protein
MTPRLIAAAILVFMGAAPAAAISLQSPDVKDGAPISKAQIYPRCGGRNVAPALAWQGAPAGTRSFVLTMIDTSVKPSLWSHWIVVDLPATATALAPGAPLPAPAKAISSNFGDAVYDGPCPPSGSGLHSYEITIWAMPDATTAIGPDAKASDVVAMLTRRSLVHATIAGTVTG